MARFELSAPFEPTGDQPQAIDAIVRGIEQGDRHQVLLGVTGSGKTFTMANVIARVQRPTLVMAPNKTLAAQLHAEFKAFFPKNAVEFFVSYYDYYQPEAYVPSSDTYIEKDALINEEIDRMRHAATYALLERRDVIIVASVSCIYGIGSAEAYYGMLVQLEPGERVRRDEILRKLVEIQYERNDHDFSRGTFRVRGDVIEVYPAYMDDKAIRISLYGDEVDAIEEIDPLRGRTLRTLDKLAIYPGSHYVTPAEQLALAIDRIRSELQVRLQDLNSHGKLLEAQRLEQRTLFDLENLELQGRCNGIENYSRHLTGRGEGDAPPTLIDYFPKNFLTIVDESHVGIPQIGGMFRGDRARKETLVDYGFRLPSALDNRPLRFEEWEQRVRQCVYVSATPGDWELQQTGGAIIEQVIRPTGLLDPEVIVRPVGVQVDDLLDEIRLRVEREERVLVTTLTKRMAEDLTEYYRELGVKVRYLHSDIDTLERVEILRELRLGKYDVLIGINLLREGLDLPEVSLVAILDADKEGFLRAERSLIQTIGRAARNANGKVLMYADKITGSMDKAIRETNRRRAIQAAYNAEHGIVPTTIVRPVHALDELDAASRAAEASGPGASADGYLSPKDIPRIIAELRREMHAASENLAFEEAAELRDRIRTLEKVHVAVG